jgi:hypothetical protein
MLPPIPDSDALSTAREERARGCVAVAIWGILAMVVFWCVALILLYATTAVRSAGRRP